MPRNRLEGRVPGRRTAPGHGRPLFENIVHFARTLRAAGLPVGPGQMIDAFERWKAAGIASKRDDFYWTLHAVFVNRRDQREMFDQAFHVYWRNPRLLKKMMDCCCRRSAWAEQPQGEELSRRLADALNPGRDSKPKEQ
jgi:uncharacterized protein with von Willebrand factor type A (vWA) domain